MRLVISHMSALDLCDRLAAEGRKVAKPCRIRSLCDCASAQRDVALFDLSELPLASNGPLDILVSDNNSRFVTSSVRRHTWGGAIPDGAFYWVCDDVYIASPEFALLLLSKSLSFNELVALSSEACGAYFRDGSERGFCDRPPLTSIAKIEAFLDKAGSASGASKLRRALRYVVENACSPMETALGVLMCMPTRMGGFGLPKPLLNYRMELDREASRMAGRGSAMFDFYFEERQVVVEYDSNQQHTGSERIASDSRRNNTLRYLGLSVINVTWPQVCSAQALDDVMQQIAHALGRDLHVPSAAARAKRRRLRADFLPRVAERSA